MAIFKKYQKLQKYYLNEAVMPPIYKKGEYLGNFQYDTIEECEGAGGPIIDNEAFMFKINVTSVPYEFNAPIINGHTSDNVTISWGDGIIESFDGEVGSSMVGGTVPPASHIYNVIGEYIITCWNQVHRIFQYSNNDPIIEIMSWGNMPHKTIGNAFANNKNLTKICGDKFGSFANITGSYNSSSHLIGGFSGTFYNTSINEIPSDLFTYATECLTFESTFSGCEKLTSIPSDLFNTNTKVLSFQSTFNSCINIELLPFTLFDKQKNMDGVNLVNFFGTTFYNCSKMKGNVIPLWEWGGNQSETLKTGCYMGCFKLDNYNIIPPAWQNYVIVP